MLQLRYGLRTARDRTVIARMEQYLNESDTTKEEIEELESGQRSQRSTSGMQKASQACSDPQCAGSEWVLGCQCGAVGQVFYLSSKAKSKRRRRHDVQ